jgi:tRNA splicing endonuclease
MQVYAPSGTLDKGEPQTRLQLMLEEALYLMGREGGVGLALVLAGRDARRMSEAETLCYCRRRKPNFDVKYAVYQHLTRRG